MKKIKISQRFFQFVVNHVDGFQIYVEYDFYGYLQ